MFSQVPSMAASARAKSDKDLIESLQAQDLSQNPHRSLSEVLSLAFTPSLLGGDILPKDHRRLYAGFSGYPRSSHKGLGIGPPSP